MNNDWQIITRHDSPTDVKRKLVMWDIKHMLGLKKGSLWWKEDEKKFVKEYGFSTDHIKFKAKVQEYLDKIKER